MKINIVLYQPEIPPNTGNIIRTCFCIGAKLHIIKPIAFDLDPKYLKRAAAGKFLDDIDHEVHDNYSDFTKKYGNKKIFYITRYGQKNYDAPDFAHEVAEEGEVFVMFGRESTGIPKNILRNNIGTCLRVPMTSESRSLNLANTVMLIGYEISRQNKFKGLSEFEVQKGKNWLLE